MTHNGIDSAKRLILVLPFLPPAIDDALGVEPGTFLFTLRVSHDGLVCIGGITADGLAWHRHAAEDQASVYRQLIDALPHLQQFPLGPGGTALLLIFAASRQVFVVD